MLKYLSASLIIIGLALLVYFYLLGRASQKQPQIVTLANISAAQTLRACPSTPNCVCSEYPNDQSHYIAPIDVSQYPNINDLTVLHDLIVKAGGSVISQNQTYLSSTFKSGLFGFVDDLEIRLDEENQKIHFRSSSRVGKSDLGVNKKRVMQLKSQFEDLAKQ